MVKHLVKRCLMWLFAHGVSSLKATQKVYDLFRLKRS